MDFNPAKILKEFYNKPIYISSRATNLTVEFVPKGSQPTVSILKHFGGEERCTLEKQYYEECGSFEFVIQKMRSKEKPIKIYLNCWDINELNSVINSTEDGSWISKAEMNLMLERPEFGRLTSEEWKAQVDLPNSTEPVVLMRTGVQNWPDNRGGAVTTGTHLSVYFQPKSLKGDAVKKPWLLEFKRYQLECREDMDIDRKNERTLSIQLSTEDMGRIVRYLGMKYLLWIGDEEAAEAFMRNPKIFL